MLQQELHHAVHQNQMHVHHTQSQHTLEIQALRDSEDKVREDAHETISAVREAHVSKAEWVAVKG